MTGVRLGRRWDAIRTGKDTNKHATATWVLPWAVMEVWSELDLNSREVGKWRDVRNWWSGCETRVIRIDWERCNCAYSLFRAAGGTVVCSEALYGRAGEMGGREREEEAEEEEEERESA